MNAHQTRELITDLQKISRAARTAEEELIESLEQQVIARVLPLYERARREDHDAVFGPLPDLKGSLRRDLEALCRDAKDLCGRWHSDAFSNRQEIKRLQEILAAIEGLA